MEKSNMNKNGQPPLVDEIIQNGKLAYDPDSSEEARALGVLKFNALLESTNTLALIPVLNLLVQPSRVPPWLRTPIIYTLARLPLRPRGVQHTIEFILSVHPSNTGSNAPTSTGRGSYISHEALNAASRLLSAPPSGMTAEDWYTGIAPQLLSLLAGEGQPGMDKAAAFVIGFGILGRRQYGAPGMPGWKAIVEPILANIDPTVVFEDTQAKTSNGNAEDLIETLGSRKVLSTAANVSKSIQQISSLLNSHPNPALTKRLLRPILLPLWALSYWPEGNEHTETNFRKPARQLLKALLHLSPATKPTSTETRPPLASEAAGELYMILENITFRGRMQRDQKSWIYTTSKDGDILIEDATLSRLSQSVGQDLDLSHVDKSIDSFIVLLEEVTSLESEISSLFLHLCKRWFSKGSSTVSKIFTRVDPRDDSDDAISSLVEAKVMQKLMTTFPDKLVDDSRQLLDLVSQILSDFANNKASNHDRDEDSVTVALSLLNIVLAAPNLQVDSENETRLDMIRTSLKGIGQMKLEVSPTAKNLLMLLEFRNAVDAPTTPDLSAPTDRQVEDRRSYNLAMSYLTTTDSPPPVRAQGLELISGLIRANSPILNIPALLVLFSSLLQDTEEYIYLRAIQSFIQLSQKHPKTVLKDIIDRYVDPNEEYELDQRLRLGEALLQVIMSHPDEFRAETARSVCEGLLFVAGRRGRKPKTEVAQEKKNKLKRKQVSEAEEAWDGPVPQLDEVLETESPEDYDIISQIVAGWESKRGMEDIRIRASSLSILGLGIEANIDGVGSKMISTAVDLSIHILTLESGLDKGILRRAAILLIMSFVRALDSARNEGKKLGFGFAGQSLDDVQRILAYIKDTDDDGLVRQHAKDVIEGLQAWQINSLIPPTNESAELQELAGLSINPRATGKPNEITKPRIEELD